jgi:hypothetical protein
MEGVMSPVAKSSKTVKKAAVKKATTRKTVTKKPSAGKAPAAGQARGRVTAEPPRPSAEERYRLVAERAYLLAERNGFGGDPVAYWLDAERELGL